MSYDEFDKLMRKIGFTDEYGMGALNHWPSGKLFRPLDYQTIKRLVELVLKDAELGNLMNHQQFAHVTARHLPDVGRLTDSQPLRRLEELHHLPHPRTAIHSGGRVITEPIDEYMKFMRRTYPDASTVYMELKEERRG